MSFEVYVTDTLQAIAENTAIPAASFTDGKHGKAISLRWAEKDKSNTPEETRTEEEVVDEIMGRFKEVSQRGLDGTGCHNKNKPG